MFKRSNAAREERARVKTQRNLNRELNRELELPKGTSHDWQLVNLRDPNDLSWRDMDGQFPVGKLAVTAVASPESDQEVQVAATEVLYPYFQFPPYRPTLVTFGVIKPRETEAGSRNGYDAALRMEAGNLPGNELPDFTLERFHDRSQFLGAVASANQVD